MKITVDVDCTPEEARRFLGFPDLTPVHDAYVAQLRRLMEDGVSADTVAEMIRGWAPMGEAGMQMWSRLFDQMGGGKR